jgi:hypothetical protein
MSFFKKIFPFLFKSEQNDSAGTPAKKRESKRDEGKSRKPGTDREGNPITISSYGIIARNRNARSLRKGSRVYVRSILDEGDRLRVRGMAPNGKKVTVTVPRRSLTDFQSEGVPDHIAKHYDSHSLYKDEHEAKMKAEALGKH